MTTSPLRRLRPAFAALSVALMLAASACSASGDDDAGVSTKGDGTSTTQPTATTESPDDTTDDTTDDTSDDTSDDTTDDTSDDTTDDTSDDTSDDATDDFDGMSRDEIVGAIADGLLGEDSIPNLDEPTAECLAGELLDIVGADKLADIGMSGGFDGIDEQSAERFAASWGTCGYDLEGFFVKTLTDSGATTAQAQCVYDEVGDEPIEKLLALGFAGMGDSPELGEIQKDIQAAVQGCR